MTKISNGQESVFGPRHMVAILGLGSLSGDWGNLRRGRDGGPRGQGMGGATGHEFIIWGSEAWFQVLAWSASLA